MCRQEDGPPGSGVLFRDRRDAGDVLAGLLTRHRVGDVVVLGISRGGVIVAAEVARRLLAALDVVVARKIGAPRSPELAIGAVTASGGLFLNEALIRDLAVPDVYLDAAVAAQRDEARRREAHFRGERPEPVLKGRTVIVVDDGIATGATFVAAARSVRSREPARLVAAAPVGSREACQALIGEVDEIVCPYVPEPFHAVSGFYRRFESVHDSLVERVLQEWAGAARGLRPFRAARPSPRTPVAS